MSLTCASNLAALAHAVVGEKDAEVGRDGGKDDPVCRPLHRASDEDDVAELTQAAHAVQSVQQDGGEDGVAVVAAVAVRARLRRLETTASVTNRSENTVAPPPESDQESCFTHLIVYSQHSINFIMNISMEY